MKSKKRIMIYGMIMICTIILGTTAVYSLAISEETAKNTKPDELDENLELTDDPIILEFCDECCNEVYINPWNQSQLGIREITWIDDTTVFVRAHASINCAFWIEGGGFHIHNNTITLTYFVGRSLHGSGILMAKCMCGVGLSFTLSNLDSSEYDFELEPIFVDHPEK